jgi:hypothetical protein
LKPHTHEIHLFGNVLKAWLDPDDPNRIVTKNGLRWSLNASWGPGVLVEVS